MFIRMHSLKRAGKNYREICLFQESNSFTSAEDASVKIPLAAMALNASLRLPFKAQASTWLAIL